MSANKEKLLKIFKSLDLNGDGELDATELSKAFEKSGQKPTLAEIYSMIATLDTTGSQTVNFDEFCTMVEKVYNGQLPKSTGIPSLIKGAWEDYIVNLNKPVEKNKVIKVVKGGRGEAKPDAPQGQKYKIEGKVIKKTYNNLPPKKSLDDLP
jgi:hypothetical protein